MIAFKPLLVQKHIENTYGIILNMNKSGEIYHKYIDIISMEVNLYDDSNLLVSIHPENCKNHKELYEKLFEVGLICDCILTKKCIAIMRDRRIEEILR